MKHIALHSGKNILHFPQKLRF